MSPELAGTIVGAWAAVAGIYLGFGSFLAVKIILEEFSDAVARSGLPKVMFRLPVAFVFIMVAGPVSVIREGLRHT